MVKFTSGVLFVEVTHGDALEYKRLQIERAGLRRAMGKVTYAGYLAKRMRAVLEDMRNIELRYS